LKPHNKRVRTRRVLAIAGCVASLAVPTAAVAMPLPPDPPASTHSTQTYAPDAFAGGLGAHPHKAPDESGARLDHRGLKEGNSSVTVNRTFSYNSDRTLAIVLAASALGIALCATGYAVVRVSRLPRTLI
jgi:hypothetical protein